MDNPKKLPFAGASQLSGRTGGLTSGANRTKEAEVFAKRLAPFVADARLAGCVTNAELADYLNRQGLRARAGGLWSKSNIRNLLTRLEAQ
jgi:hypothetical protein